MQVDLRGLRFGAAVTTPVLALVLLTGGSWLPGVGMAFGIMGMIGFATGITPLALGATAAALLAAFLKAAFGLCLGSEMYVIIRRLQPGRMQ